MHLTLKILLHEDAIQESSLYIFISFLITVMSCSLDYILFHQNVPFHLVPLSMLKFLVVHSCYSAEKKIASHLILS